MTPRDHLRRRLLNVAADSRLPWGTQAAALLDAIAELASRPGVAVDLGSLPVIDTAADPVPDRACVACGRTLPEGMRPDAKHCSQACRTRACRARAA